MDLYMKYRYDLDNGKKIDYLATAIKMCRKLDKKKTDTYNSMIVEYAFFILLSDPVEIRATAYNKLHHILIATGNTFAEHLMADNLS